MVVAILTQDNENKNFSVESNLKDTILSDLEGPKESRKSGK